MQNKESEKYSARQKKISSRLRQEGIFAAVISDFENSRNSSLRYLSGHPMDAILILFSDGKSTLVPWDINMAEKEAHVSEAIPYTDFSRDFILALKHVAGSSGPDDGGEKIIELSSSLSYPLVVELKKSMPDFTFLCTDNGIDSLITSERIIKDSFEISFLRKAASITDSVFQKIEKVFTMQDKLTETDIALLIETEARKLGGEGTGFETLVASPERSFSIHPFPSYSNAPAKGCGFTIVDFGIKYSGYTSDVTTTVAAGKLKGSQEKMITLVTEATSIFENLLAPGASSFEITKAVTDFFRSNGYSLPHALGHGIGLDVHESPVLKDLKETETQLRAGMVLAVEPGIYSPEDGGVRLENDYLITDSGFEKLTNSRIIRLPEC